METSSNKRKIELLYNMVYPYGQFNGDYSMACIKLRREILKLCKEKRIDILTVINRALGFNVYEKDDIKTLCYHIIENLLNTCLSIDPKVTVDFGLNIKSGLVPYKNIDPLYRPLSYRYAYTPWGRESEFFFVSKDETDRLSKQRRMPNIYQVEDSPDVNEWDDFWVAGAYDKKNKYILAKSFTTKDEAVKYISNQTGGLFSVNKINESLRPNSSEYLHDHDHDKGFYIFLFDSNMY